MKRRDETVMRGCVQSAYKILANIVTDIEGNCNIFFKFFKIRHIFQLSEVYHAKLEIFCENLPFSLEISQIHAYWLLYKITKEIDLLSKTT